MHSSACTGGTLLAARSSGPYFQSLKAQVSVAAQHLLQLFWLQLCAPVL